MTFPLRGLRLQEPFALQPLGAAWPISLTSKAG